MTPALLVLALTLLPSQGVSDTASLFKAMRTDFNADAGYPMKKPTAPIQVYATDDLNTKACFIREGVIYTYTRSEGRIMCPLIQKVFNIKAVNRITYLASDAYGLFQLWIDDEMVLSIGF